jgi:hypothetical protein
VNSNEKGAFVELIVAYKTLWVEHAAQKFVPSEQAGTETQARKRLQEIADDAFSPVSVALLAGTPLLAPLNSALKTLPPR